MLESLLVSDEKKEYEEELDQQLRSSLNVGKNAVTSALIYGTKIERAEMNYLKSALKGICQEPMVTDGYIDTFLKSYEDVRSVEFDPLKKETTFQDDPRKSSFKVLFTDGRYRVDFTVTNQHAYDRIMENTDFTGPEFDIRNKERKPGIIYYSISGIVETFALFYTSSSDARWGKHLYLDVWCKRPRESTNALGRLARHLLSRVFVIAHSEGCKRVILSVLDTTGKVSEYDKIGKATHASYKELGFEKIMLQEEFKIVRRTTGRGKNKREIVSEQPVERYDVLALQLTDVYLSGRVARNCKYVK